MQAGQAPDDALRTGRACPTEPAHHPSWPETAPHSYRRRPLLQPHPPCCAASSCLHPYRDEAARLAFSSRRRLRRSLPALQMECPEKPVCGALRTHAFRSEEHTSELQSLMRPSYAVFCLKKKLYTKPP